MTGLELVLLFITLFTLYVVFQAIAKADRLGTQFEERLKRLEITRSKALKDDLAKLYKNQDAARPEPASVPAHEIRPTKAPTDPDQMSHGGQSIPEPKP